MNHLKGRKLWYIVNIIRLLTGGLGNTTNTIQYLGLKNCPNHSAQYRSAPFISSGPSIFSLNMQKEVAGLSLLIETFQPFFILSSKRPFDTWQGFQADTVKFFSILLKDLNQHFPRLHSCHIQTLPSSPHLPIFQMTSHPSSLKILQNTLRVSEEP